MTKPKPPKKRMGRPPKPGAQRYTIRISSVLAEQARIIGDGEMTRGIEIAVAEHRRRK